MLLQATTQKPKYSNDITTQLRVRQPVNDFELSVAQRLSLSSVGPFGLSLSILICFFALRSGGQMLALGFLAEWHQSQAEEEN